MFLFLQELIKIILLLNKIDQLQTPMNLPLVQFKNVTINQNKQTILSDVNIEVKSGEFVFLIGKTGTGKSSLIKTLYADLPLSDGTARVSDFDLGKIKQKQIPFFVKNVVPQKNKKMCVCVSVKLIAFCSFYFMKKCDCFVFLDHKQVCRLQVGFVFCSS